MSLLLTNCDVVAHDERYNADILIENDKIAQIIRADSRKTEDLRKRFKDEVRDLTGLLIFPGFIDTHVHFREPGYEIAEDFTSGSQAALRGGVTTILDMPNNNPGITSIEALENKRKLAENSMQVNYGFYIAATNANLDEISKAERIAGVKLFYGSTTGDILVDDAHAVERLFEHCPHKIIVHAEDEAVIQANSKSFSFEKHASIHYSIRSKMAAIVAIKKIIELTERFNSNTHIAHLSSPEEVELLRNTSLTGEIAIPHLFFNITDYETLGNLIKCNPSVKCSQSEIEKLWHSFIELKELQVVTDHAPHPLENKDVEDYWKAKSGIPSVENASRLLFKAVSDNKLTLSDVARVYSYNPAQNFNIKKRGEIKEDFFADFAIVNPNKSHKIQNKKQISRCGWTPFNGFEVPYDIEMTILNGKIVYENGKFNAEDARNSATEVFLVL